MCKGSCCCVTPSQTTAIIGFVFSSIELILACVYNFHAFGCGLAALGLVASVAFFFYIRWEEKDDNRDSINSDTHKYQPLLAVEELAR